MSRVDPHLEVHSGAAEGGCVGGCGWEGELLPVLPGVGLHPLLHQRRNWANSWFGSGWRLVLESPELCSSSRCSRLEREEGPSARGRRSAAAARWKGTFSGQALGGVHGFSTQAAHHVVHHGLMAQEDGSNHLVVDDLGAVPGDRRHAPQQEETLGREETGSAFRRSKRTQPKKGCFGPVPPIRNL